MPTAPTQHFWARAAGVRAVASPVPRRVMQTGVGLVAVSLLCSCSDPGRAGKSDRGLAYSHERIPSAPWSVHMVKMERGEASLELHSLLARGNAIGLTPLSKQ